MAHLGFLINPIAGMGGRVGLKGTDGVAARAARLGAAPIANSRALEALHELKTLCDQDAQPPAIRWLTCSGAMGFEALRTAGFEDVEVAHEASGATSAQHTIDAVRRFVARGVDLVLFCGGDGTARDICGIAGEATPVLGIPSGVKMYSGVFGVTPARTADVLFRFLKREVGLASVEIMDLDEEAYRRGEWVVRLHMLASTPFEPSYVQAAKAMFTGRDEAAVKEDIAAQIREEIETDPDTLFLLGPGSTVQAVGRALCVDKSLLGIDAVVGDQLVGKDLDERRIIELLRQYPRRKLVLSPVGAQGFVLGRGNLQLSPAVVRSIGVDNIIVIATPAKLARTPVLRFDTGDSGLDLDIISRKFLPVVNGYRRSRLVKVAG
jgi:predicted polyphosphate/ATP-dependent NAD kinase